MRYVLIPSKWLSSRRQETTGTGEDVMRREALYTVDGNAIAPPTMETTLNTDVPYYPAIALLGTYPKEMKTEL